MKLTIDTARDNPRLIRAAIATVLEALDNGTTLPVGIPQGTILTDNEARNAGFGPGDYAPITNQIPPGALRNVVPLAPNPPAASVPLPPVASSAGASAPPPPPVPSVPGAAPMVPAPGSERDVEGLPWDSRIHSSSRAKIANGTWKLAKGMSLQPSRVEAVKAELRALMAIPSPAAVAVAMVPIAPLAPAPSTISVVPAAPAPLPPVPALATGTPPPPPPAPSVPGAAPMAPAPASADPATFAEFMGWVAGLINGGKWTHQQTTVALESLGLQSAVGLSARADLIPPAVATIKAMLPA